MIQEFLPISMLYIRHSAAFLFQGFENEVTNIEKVYMDITDRNA